MLRKRRSNPNYKVRIPMISLWSRNRRRKKRRKILKNSEMSKDIMSSKNRKLLKAIEIGKRKGRTENARL
jgi:hypothetical protein